MPISFTAPVVSNATQLAGNQSEVRTAGLANGGYVVAWQSSSGGPSNVFFQRYDAAGVQVGAVTQVTNPSSANMLLRDIEVSVDGTFSILTQGAVGLNPADQRLFVSSFFGTTGGPSGPQAQLNLTGFSSLGVSGAQLVPGSFANTVFVLASVPDSVSGQDLIRAVVTTAGVVSGIGPAEVTNGYAGDGIIEAVSSVGPQQFAISSATIIDTLGSAAAVTAASDVLAIAPGSIVVARPTPGSPDVVLTLLFGNSASVLGLGTSGGVTGASASGATTSGAQAFAIELVDLGAGRILVVWVADGGDSFTNNALIDGVYAQVYNMNTGATELSATRIKDFGVGFNDTILSTIDISADMMADGRVALGLSFDNGLSGFDVFNAILDPRDKGVVVTAASNGAEAFVGTAFADTFKGIDNGDQVSGGAGLDTVFFVSNRARFIDLQDPGNFPTSTITLTGIENLTGSSLNDELRGDGLGNLLAGGIGDDTLSGRNGDDTLQGGAGNDLVNGGTGANRIDGEAGLDTLIGGDGTEAIFGGTDADRVLARSGNDTISGGDGNDRLFGEAGNDLVAGDAGDDLISGGLGDDEAFGGAGADTLRSDGGVDQLFGGTENDLIQAGADVLLVSGGSGLDSLQVGNDFDSASTGFLVDLTGVFNVLGVANSLTRFEADISGIETLIGGTGNDFLIGDQAANLLNGGQGADTLVGGGGLDTLVGGAGADVFVFAAPSNDGDQLRGFTFGQDKIGLVTGAFGDINATNIATRLTVNATATVGATAVAQLIFDTAGGGFGSLFFDADGSGAGGAVLLATLTPATGTLVSITAADFLFL